MGNMPAIQHIPFRRLPQHSSLFLDYLAREEKALSFYRHPPTMEGLVQSAKEILGCAFPRKEMVEILKQQNGKLRCGAKTLENLRALEGDDCVAVVTGQQVGLFSGPAYTIYKALTTLRLAEELRSRNIPAVPIFWMESEDHDLAEVTRLTLLDPDFRIQTDDSRKLLFGVPPEQQRSVGSIPLPETISRLIELYTSRLAAGAGHAGVKNLLESTYRPGFSLCEAFGRLMAQLFKDYGLVLFDSQAPGARRLISGLFGKAIGDAEAILAALKARTRTVEDAGFHSQVIVRDDSTLLFLHQGGERRALAREGTDFPVRNTDIRFTREELTRVAEEEPERLSPNVLLRPLVQDSLFPTAAYIGGPSEIAYFAQIEALYRHFNRPMPAIWPRRSIACIDADLAQQWKESGLSYEDCFTQRNSVVRKILKGDSPDRSVLDRLRKDLSQELKALGPLMGRVDQTLEAAAATAERKMLHNIDKLQAKIAKLDERENEALVAMADRYINQCYPDGHLQERTLGIPYFISRYGPDLIDRLYPLVETDRFDHCVIELERTAPLDQ